MAELKQGSDALRGSQSAILNNMRVMRYRNISFSIVTNTSIGLKKYRCRETCQIQTTERRKEVEVEKERCGSRTSRKLQC